MNPTLELRVPKMRCLHVSNTFTTSKIYKVFASHRHYDARESITIIKRHVLPGRSDIAGTSCSASSVPSMALCHKSSRSACTTFTASQEGESGHEGCQDSVRARIVAFHDGVRRGARGRAEVFHRGAHKGLDVRRLPTKAGTAKDMAVRWSVMTCNQE